MCYADPKKSLELSRARLTPEQWEKFEADFEHFCAYSGILMNLRPESVQADHLTFEWARWAYLCGKGL
jgi:Asp-tRNA(Asn)/Glu-tRNA(Gln) amidotransferase C subunit